MAIDKRIPELDPIVQIDGSMLLAVYDPSTDKTYRVLINLINPAMGTTSFRWMPGPAIYNIDDIVTSDDLLWISLQNGNIDNVPVEGAFWHQIVKSKSGLVKYVPGTFTDDEVYVVSNHTGFYNIYTLVNPARPYNSTDLATEVGTGDWEAFGVGGGGGASGRLVFRFNSDLFTEDEQSFRGSIVFVSATVTDGLTALTFGARLDASVSFDPLADLSDLNTWIATNVGGDDETGDIFWIKIYATYDTGATKVVEVSLKY